MTQQCTCLVLNNSLNCDIAGSHSSAAEESGLVGRSGVSMDERYISKVGAASILWSSNPRCQHVPLQC